MNRAPTQKITSPPSIFSVLDLLLVQQGRLADVLEAASDRSAILASHHFPVVFTIHVSIPRAKSYLPASVDWSSLENINFRQRFSQRIARRCMEGPQSWASYCEMVHDLAKSELPVKQKQPNKPWISQATLELLEARRTARLSGNFILEKDLRKATNKSAAKDRTAWLERLGSEGDWKNLAKLREGFKPKQGRLRNMAGQIVSSEDSAETLAEYLENV